MPMFSYIKSYVFNVPTTTALNVKYYYERKEFKCTYCGWDSWDPKFILPGWVTELLTPITNADLYVRAARLLIAIDKCIVDDRNSVNAGVTNDKATLRVFVAPEFYFRPVNVSATQGGFYTKTEFGQLTTVLMNFFNKCKTRHTDCTSLENWVFLCGTCVFDDDGIAATVLKNMMIVCTVNKSGETYKAETRLIRKMHTSPIDGIDDGIDFNKKPGIESFNTAERLNHFLPDYRLFVEICFEHYCKLMVETVEDAKTRMTRLPVTVHVISAAGMGIIPANTLPHTMVFRNDGYRYCLKDKTMITGEDKDDPTMPILFYEIPDGNVAPWKDIAVDGVFEHIGVHPGDASIQISGDCPLSAKLFVCRPRPL